jgi:hypothetical protein
VLARARGRLAEIDKARQTRRDALRLPEATVDGPRDFCCPILVERMVDPVVASDGHSYEREAILAVLGARGSKLSPLTREPLTPHVIPNRTLLRRISAYDEEMLRVAEIAAAEAVKAERSGAKAAAAAAS